MLIDASRTTEVFYANICYCYNKGVWFMPSSVTDISGDFFVLIDATDITVYNCKSYYANRCY